MPKNNLRKDLIMFLIIFILSTAFSASASYALCNYVVGESNWTRYDRQTVVMLALIMSPLFTTFLFMYFKTYSDD